jgi:hypothetical protein
MIMVKVTKSTRTQLTYVNHYHVDEALVIENFGSVERFEEICTGEGAEPTDDEAEVMYAFQEILQEMIADEYFESHGEFDYTDIHFGHIDPNARMFVKNS